MQTDKMHNLSHHYDHHLQQYHHLHIPYIEKFHSILHDSLNGRIEKHSQEEPVTHEKASTQLQVVHLFLLIQI
jgi:hypothetical protein